MNRRLAAMIGQLFRAPDDDKGGGGGGGDKTQEQTPPAVKPEDARTFLSEFGHNADALKGMKDEDVVKLHGQVSTNYTKRVQTETAAAQEKAKAAAIEAAKGLKLELPKDSKLVQADVDRVAAIARERGLSKEQAEVMLKTQSDAVEAYEARLQEGFKAKRAEWVKTVQDDKDLGGANLAATQKNAQRVIDTFMDTELRTFLKDSGYGDHPFMVRFLNKVGKAMAEDKALGGGGGGGGGNKSPADVLYGTPQT